MWQAWMTSQRASHLSRAVRIRSQSSRGDELKSSRLRARCERIAASFVLLRTVIQGSAFLAVMPRLFAGFFNSSDGANHVSAQQKN